ncbi:MAG: hypothetical protein AAFN41_03680 [Planctomycetota bacterium]
MNDVRILVASAAAIACASPAFGQAFTFDSLAHGEIVTNQYEPMMTISAENYRRPHNLLVGFNTNATGTADPDLEAPWLGGNLLHNGVSTDLGTALIISETDVDADGDGIIDDPSDEGLRPAGRIDIEFARPVPMFGLDVVDIEGQVSEFSSLVFFVNGSAVGVVDFEDFENPASQYYDPTIIFGNNSANRIKPILASDFNVEGFDGVKIYVGGSSAYDTFFIPAPASAAVLGFAGVAASRRRRAG